MAKERDMMAKRMKFPDESLIGKEVMSRQSLDGGGHVTTVFARGRERRAL